MTKDEFKNLLLNADASSTLLTPKHDPGKLSATWDSYRSVLSYELADQLSGFITSGNWNLEEYKNTDYQMSPDYWIMYPTDPNFSVPASGVPGYSSSPDIEFDCLVVVSGQDQGLHMFGEDSSEVAQKEKAGILINKRTL